MVVLTPRNYESMHAVILLNVSYIICTIEVLFFLHRFWTTVSYSEAGTYVPTFSRFRITLRRFRPHEPASRPRRAGSPRAPSVAGGHGSGISKRKGSPRVEKRAAKRGEHSDFHPFNDTILELRHTFKCSYPTLSESTDRASRPSGLSAVGEKPLGYVAPSDVFTIGVKHSTLFFWPTIA